MAIGDADDTELMTRFSQLGDRAAFEELARRWDRRVLAFLSKSCGDAEAAHDLRQEVFIRIYRYGASYDPRFRFTTWLFRIAANVLRDWLARQARDRELARSGQGKPDLPAMDPPDPAPAQSERMMVAEADDALRAMLARLSPDERELILLRFDAGMSYREIGEIRHVPETTVKSRIYKLLGRLRRQLDPLESEPKRRGS
jgi:RNA polymerase sigma-70 factor, ECF subfamily